MKEVDFVQDLIEKYNILSNQDGPKENIDIVSDLVASDWKDNVQEFGKRKIAEYIAGEDSGLFMIKDCALSNRKVEYVAEGKLGLPFNIDGANLCKAKIPDAGSIPSKS
eukprot:11093297-Ditylum_brightwellii.AAC.1